jgi:putative flippase GtrA
MKQIKAIANSLMDRTFLRFVIVGMINTAFGYSVFAFFLYVGLHYSVAALLGTILGVLFNFKTIGLLVFRKGKNSLIFRFSGVYAFTYSLNVGSLKILKMNGVNMYLAGAILLAPMAIITFSLNKLYVFNDDRKPLPQHLN